MITDGSVMTARDPMKKLKVLTVSDLHLGEGDSLLHDNDFGIIDTTVGKIRELSRAGENEDAESGIDTLILLGDIVDLSEAQDNKAYGKTRFFLGKLTHPGRNPLPSLGGWDHIAAVADMGSWTALIIFDVIGTHNLITFHCYIDLPRDFHPQPEPFLSGCIAGVGVGIAL